MAAEVNALLELLTASTQETDAVAGRILDATREEVLGFGLRRTNVDDVARRAGVSRATVYRRFDNKQALVQAVLIRECHRLFTEIVLAIGPLPSVADRLVEGFVVGLRYAREDPLLSRLLATDPDALIPYLTVDGAEVIAVAAGFLVAQYRQAPDGTVEEIDGRTVAGVAEIFVRLAISLVLSPQSCIPLADDRSVRAFARSYLAPLMAPAELPAN